MSTMFSIIESQKSLRNDANSFYIIEIKNSEYYKNEPHYFGVQGWNADNPISVETIRVFEKLCKPFNTLDEARKEFAALIEDDTILHGFNRMTENTSTWTKWGKADSVTKFASGINFYSTPSHGGFVLSEGMQKKMHPALALESRSYEEDCEWARVALSFPQFFSPSELSSATLTAKNWFPHEYEKFSGEKVSLAESTILRKEAFIEATKNQFVVRSAINDSSYKRVATMARLGGDYQNASTEKREFYVKQGEYKPGENGHIINPLHSPECNKSHDHWLDKENGIIDPFSENTEAFYYNKMGCLMSDLVIPSLKDFEAVITEIQNLAHRHGFDEMSKKIENGTFSHLQGDDDFVMKSLEQDDFSKDPYYTKAIKSRDLLLSYCKDEHKPFVQDMMDAVQLGYNQGTARRLEVAQEEYDAKSLSLKH